MSVRVKTLLLIISVYLCSFAAVYVVGHRIFLGSYESLQLADAAKSAVVAERTVEHELARLSALASDYGAWTDTFWFLHGTNPGYPKEFLSSNDLVELHVNVIMFMDVRRQPVMALTLDERTGEVNPCPAQLIEAIRKALKFRTTWNAKSLQFGVMDTPTSPLMVAVHPILKSNHLGPQAGYCVMGRYLDTRECKRMGNQLELSVGIRKLDTLPGSVGRALTASKAHSASSNTASGKLVTGYATLPSLGRESPLVISTNQTPTIYLQGKAGFHDFLLILLLVGGVIMVTVSIGMENTLLRRLRRLSDDVVAVGEGKNLSARIRSGDQSAAQDEIDKLSTNINSMLSVLEAAEKETHAEGIKGETLLRSMTTAFPLAFYVVDNRDDSVVYSNRQFCNIWSIEHLEEDIRNGKLKNNDVIPYCIPMLSDVEAFAESCKPLQHEANRSIVEDEIPFVDGRTIRRFSAQIRGADDTYFGRLYLFEDITARKRVEQKILDNESRTRAVLENVQTGILMVDPKTHEIVNVNQAVADMIGAPKEDIVGSPCHKYICIGDNEACPCCDSPQPVGDTEQMLILADGRRKPVIITTATVNLIGSDFLLASIVDISARKQAEDDLRKRDILLVGSADATKVLLEERDFTAALAEAVRLLGEITGMDRVYVFENHTEPDNLMNQRVEWTSDGTEPQIDNLDLQNVPYYPNYARIYEMLSHKQVVTGLIRDFPDTERPILEAQDIKSILLVPILLGEKFWGFIGFDDCHSERVWTPGETAILQSAAGSIGSALARKLAEERLKQSVGDLYRSNQDLEQFAYVASHDLQEPLRMVSNYVELLSRRYKGELDERADKYIQFAVDGVFRMWQLIDDLLTYSRAGLNENRSMVCMELVVNEAMHNIIESIDSTDTLITHNALPEVRGEQSQLVQLMQNVFSNAIKFRGQDSPKIHISAEQQDGEWVFGVRDNGIGIDPLYAERIFVIFQRLHTNTEYPGTGIGLAVCKKIIERHGGRIWVSPQQQGLTVYFTLPIQGGNVQQ